MWYLISNSNLVSHSMQEQKYLSPHSAMALVILQQLGGTCEVSILALLLGLSEIDLTKYIKEMDRHGLIKTISERSISIVCEEKLPINIIDQALFASTLFTKGSVASAFYSYYRGDYKSFLDQALSALQTFIKKDKPLALRRAYDVIVYGILKMRIPLTDREACLFFIDKCMRIQRDMLRFPSNSRNQLLLFSKIKGIAHSIGDKRSIGYINIYMGSVNQNIRALSKSNLFHKRMKSGKEIIFSLGDKDLIMMSAPFIVLYYMLESDFKEGLNFAYSVMFAEEEESDKYLTASFYSYTALCAASMGNYELASNILNSGIQKISQSDKYVSIDTLKAILSYVYILQSKHESALQIIDDLLGKHSWSIMTYSDLWASRALAFYHFKCGDLQKSYSCFRNLLHNNSVKGISHSNYLLSPFVLELLGAYYVAGYQSPQGLTIHEEVRHSINSPNKLVRAIAMCVAGQICAHDLGWADPQVQIYLEKSLKLFRSFPAQPDMAKTLMAIAQMHQSKEEMEKARDAAAEAWEIIQLFGQPSWQTDLDPILNTSVKSELANKPRQLDLKIQLLQNIRSAPTLTTTNHFFESLLGSLFTTLGINSGCIFKMEDSSFKLKCSVSMAPDNESASTYCRDLCSKAFQKKCSSIVKTSPYAYNDEDEVIIADNNITSDSPNTSIIIFVDAAEYGTYVFFLSGNILKHIADAIDGEFLAFAENYLSAQICIVLAQNANWQNILDGAAQVPVYSNDEGYILFQSTVMKQLIDRVDTLAQKDASVIIHGESGVGKELIAQRIHSKSLRKGNFVSVNLANIPFELFESECYGYEKGSFTGATHQKKGLFELADGGTLFIDEVGDIPFPLQVKLLRVLQEKEFMRVGGTKTLRSNFRLITATNRDLRTEMLNGRFREDLYYRLNVLSINVPPLRERQSDILFLVNHFLQYYCKRHQIPLRHLSEETKFKIVNYHWPGNIRELKNYIERYCILSENEVTLPQIRNDDTLAVTSSISKSLNMELFAQKPSLRDLTDSYFEYIYQSTNGVVGGKEGITSILRISRTTAYKWIDRLALKEKYSTPFH